MVSKPAEINRLREVPGMRLGVGVRMQGIRSELLLGLTIASGLCQAEGWSIIITSITNGKHMRNSLHYVGAAVDFILQAREGRAELVGAMQHRLGVDFDVIDEGTHIHIEYQPHHGLGTQEHVT